MILGEPEPLTANDWEHCADLRRMLWALQEQLTERQALEFGCACCRRIWPWLVDPRSREAVELIEQGLAARSGEYRRDEAFALAEAAREPVFRQAYASGHDVFHPTVDASWAVRALAFFRAPWMLAWQTAIKCASTVAESIAQEGEAHEAAKAAELAWQTDLLRELVPNPCRPLRREPGWFTPEVAALTRAIHAEEAFHDLPELADRLRAAGCDEEAVLRHLGCETEHRRGCWALEWVLASA